MTGMLAPALLALVPLAVGPLTTAEETLTAKLCNGGTIEIPLKREKQPVQPCAAKGCHAGSCRKRFDLPQ